MMSAVLTMSTTFSESFLMSGLIGCDARTTTLARRRTGKPDRACSRALGWLIIANAISGNLQTQNDLCCVVFYTSNLRGSAIGDVRRCQPWIPSPGLALDSSCSILGAFGELGVLKLVQDSGSYYPYYGNDSRTGGSRGFSL